MVKDDPPSTIKGWVKSSVVSLAVKALDLIAVILLFVTVTTGVPAEVTKIDLIIIVSFTPGSPAAKTVNAPPVVSLSLPTNLYWFTTAIILKRNF